MAEQLNKLGKVLVYDSSVDLKDRSAGGNGFQSVTLDNAGAYIGGIPSFDTENSFLVKATGTSTENAQSFIDAYNAAGEASLTKTELYKNFSTSALPYQWSFGDPGDTSLPFEVINEDYSSNAFFYLIFPYPGFSYTYGAEYEFILKGVNGEYAKITTNIYSIGFLSGTIRLGLSISAILEGEAFPLDNLSTSNVILVEKIQQTLYVSPGKYTFSDTFYFNKNVNVIAIEKQKSIFEISYYLGNFLYSGNEDSSEKITIDGLVFLEETFNFTANASAGIFKNLIADDGSFIWEVDGAAGHEFYNCESEAGYSFMGGRSSAIDCKFYNCKSGPRSFGSYLSYSMENCEFHNCTAGNESFLYDVAQNSSHTINNVRITNCIGGYSSFLVSCGHSSTVIDNILIKNCISTDGGSFGVGTRLVDGPKILFDSCVSDCEPDYNGSQNGSFYFSTANNSLSIVFKNCIGYSLQDFPAAVGQYVTYIGCSGMAGGWTNYNNRSVSINCYMPNTTLETVDTFRSGKIINCVDSTLTSKTLP